MNHREYARVLENGWKVKIWNKIVTYKRAKTKLERRDSNLMLQVAFGGGEPRPLMGFPSFLSISGRLL